MTDKDNKFLLSASPVLLIGDTEALIVHLDKLNTNRCEHLDVQIPGYHILNRIGFKEDEDLRGAMEYIDCNMDFIWELAEHNSFVYAAASL